MVQGWQLWGMEDLRKLGKSGVGTAVLFSRVEPSGKRVTCFETVRMWWMYTCGTCLCIVKDGTGREKMGGRDEERVCAESWDESFCQSTKQSNKPFHIVRSSPRLDSPLISEYHTSHPLTTLALDTFHLHVCKRSRKWCERFEIPPSENRLVTRSPVRKQKSPNENQESLPCCNDRKRPDQHGSRAPIISGYKEHLTKRYKQHNTAI
jgi:hypothetical protein